MMAVGGAAFVKYGPILGDVDLTQMDIVPRGPPGSDAGNAVLVADIDGDSHRDLVVPAMRRSTHGQRTRLVPDATPVHVVGRSRTVYMGGTAISGDDL